MSDRKPSIKIDHLLTFDAITSNQELARRAWKHDGDHLVLAGSAGTGKTFTALYLALEDVLDKQTPWDNVTIVRSVVPTREVGFLPGSAKEKLDPFTAPYRSICKDLFDRSDAYDQLVQQQVIHFESTSFIRGLTLDDTIVIVDEMQNLNFHELDSVITRVGENSRIIFCGDYKQSDFQHKKDKEGIQQFLNIVELLKNFTIVEFGWQDIVRSDFVRDYIMTKEMMEDHWK